MQDKTLLWDAEDRSGYASTARLLVALLRLAAVLGVSAAVVSAFTAWSVIAEADLARLLHFAQVAVAAYVAVVFFRWLATACLIAREVAADDFEFFPHGAVASFFIPLVNLFLPYRIMKTMCAVSLRACRRGVMQHSGMAVIVPADLREGDDSEDDVVDFWWASMLTMLIVLAVVAGTGGSPFAPVVAVAADIALACTAMAAVRVVRVITRAQLPAAMA